MKTDQLNHTIGRVRLHARWVWWATTILGTAGIAALGLLVALGLDRWLILPPTIRVVLLIGLAGGLIWFGRRCRALRPSTSLEETALLIEKQYPELDNVLINSLQLSQDSPHGSEPIVAAVADSAGKAITGLRPKSAVHKRILIWATVAAVTGGVTFAGGVKLYRTGLAQGLNRVLLPFGDNTLTQIRNVSPGDADVLARSETTITATVAGRVPSEGRLICTVAGKRQITIPMHPQSGDLPDRLTATIPSVAESLRYRVVAGDDRSEVFALRVHERPKVRKIVQTIAPPDYIEADPVEQTGGTVRALAGSKVTLQVHVTEDLRHGNLVFDDGGERPLTLEPADPMLSDGQGSAGHVEFVVERAGRYTLDITSVHGFAGEREMYDMIPLTDHPPQVRFMSPAADTATEVDAKLAVEIRADDDFAVREVKLLKIPQTAYVEPSDAQEPAEIASWKFDDRRQQKVVCQKVLSVAELGLSDECPILLKVLAYDYRPEGVPGVAELTLTLKSDAIAESLEMPERAERVSLAALIAKQRANIAAGKAMLRNPDTGDIVVQIERQEEIRADALSIAGHAGPGPQCNPFTKRKLTNLAETLMVLAIEQLREVPSSAGPTASLARALATEKAILGACVSVDVQQDQDLAEAQQRRIAELLTELIARQKTLRKDTADGKTDSGTALSLRQRALARDLAWLQREIEDSAAGDAGGNGEFAEACGRAAAILTERAVRGNMLLAAEHLADSAAAQATALQDKVIADLTEIQKLLQSLAVKKATQQVRQVSEATADFAKRLEKMTDIQQAIVEVAKQLQKTKDRTDGAPETAEHLKDLVEARENIAETIEQIVADMHLLPDVSVSNDLLAEMSEIYEDVKQAPGSENDPVSEIAVDRDEGALEYLRDLQKKMKERLGDLETWLADRPDSAKWNQESFDRDELGKIPLGDLPDALEDIVGELLDQAEELAAEAQDSTSNVSLPDVVMGWAVMDGPMPSWAAKGKSGNTRPNSAEQVGRSGSGRQGASSGEIVGDTLKALEGSDVKARRTRDGYQAGELQEEQPGFLDAKATGGGKLAGTTESEGMQGDAPATNELKYRRLAQRAKQVHRSAETIYSKARILRLPVGELDRALLEMDAAMRRLAGGDLEGFGRDQQRVVHSLKWTHGRLGGKAVVQGRSSQTNTDLMSDATKEPIPEEYEDMVGQYMRHISQDE